MREFKFRAWDKEQLVMVYENENDDAGYWDGVYCSNVQMVNARFRSDFYEWMQYTGLKDKNGKEIYESDILKDESCVGRVTWVQEHCAFLVFVPGDSSRYYLLESDGQLTSSEVIGNVYENPELLK